MKSVKRKHDEPESLNESMLVLADLIIDSYFNKKKKNRLECIKKKMIICKSTQK